MVRLNPGVQASKRQRTKDHSARALIFQIMTRYRRWTIEECYDRFMVEYLQDRQRYQDEVTWHFFVQNYNLMRKKSESLLTEAEIRAKAELEIAIKQTTELIKAAIRGINLLDYVVLSGRRLAEATGAECESYGYIFSAIAAKVPPDRKVGDVLTEDQLRDVINAELS